jgi:hypothetical protein
VATRVADSASHRFEFAAVGDSGAIWIGTVGIFFVSWIAAVIVAIPLSLLGARLNVIPQDLPTEVFMGATFLVALTCAVQWVRYHRSIPRERKIVVDQSGVTYVRSKNRQCRYAWDDIRKVTEDVYDDATSSAELKYHLRWGRFVVDSSAFDNYLLLKLLTVGRLPERTSLAEDPNMSDADVRAVAMAFRAWGLPDHADRLPTRNRTRSGYTAGP